MCYLHIFCYWMYLRKKFNIFIKHLYINLVFCFHANRHITLAPYPAFNKPLKFILLNTIPQTHYLKQYIVSIFILFFICCVNNLYMLLLLYIFIFFIYFMFSFY